MKAYIIPPRFAVLYALVGNGNSLHQVADEAHFACAFFRSTGAVESLGMEAIETTDTLPTSYYQLVLDGEDSPRWFKELVVAANEVLRHCAVSTAAEELAADYVAEITACIRTSEEDVRVWFGVAHGRRFLPPVGSFHDILAVTVTATGEVCLASEWEAITVPLDMAAIEGVLTTRFAVRDEPHLSMPEVLSWLESLPV